MDILDIESYLAIGHVPPVSRRQSHHVILYKVSSNSVLS